MAPSRHPCPVSPRAPQPARADQWPAQALQQAEALHRSLSIAPHEWHAHKQQRPRRAAEQISAALVQLLAGDDPSTSAPSAARLQAIALLEHSLGWLKRELRDPGCPTHQR